MTDRHLTPIPLTAKRFAEFGEVVELAHARQISINHGLTTRFHDLLTIDANDRGGRPIINVFRTAPLPLPHRVKIMERHPLGSQGFIPMSEQPFLVLVANPSTRSSARSSTKAPEKLSQNDLTLFVTNGRQGINLKKNTWHHFQIVLGGVQDFIVIDRGGSGDNNADNLEEIEVDGEVWISDTAQFKPI